MSGAVAQAEPQALRATADTYVRDGSYAATNYGAAAQLQVKQGAAGYTRETYLRFDVWSVPDVASATLRLLGKLDNTEAPTASFAVYNAADTGWSEEAVTWNARVAAGAAVHATGTVTGTTARWYEADLTQLLSAERAAGRDAITLVLRSTAASKATVLFDGDEAANPPQLVVASAGPAPQALVVSTPTLSVPEGGGASFSVKLAAQPASDVIVNISKAAAGDADLASATGSLVFTPANWDVPQAVQITAAPDADATNGTAAFSVAAEGLDPKTVAATETDKDGPLVLRAVADAYVADGTAAGANFGSADQLQLKHGAAGTLRESHLRFDLSSVTSVGSATLRLFGKLDDAVSAVRHLFLYSPGDPAWGESSITWSNKPASGDAFVGEARVHGTGGGWVEVDLTRLIMERKAAGAAGVTFVLKATDAGGSGIAFASDEAAANRPELVVAPLGGVTPAVTSFHPAWSVYEGGWADVAVSLSARPAEPVTLTVARSGGDTDVTARTSALTFTPQNWDVQQHVLLDAADDPDETSGTAHFVVGGPGVAPLALVAVEADNDYAAGSAPARDLRPDADAYVRNGAHVDANFGQSTQLVAGRLDHADARTTFLRFDLRSVTDVQRAYVRLFGGRDNTLDNYPQEVSFNMASSDWSESSVTWRTQPAASFYSAGSFRTPATEPAKWHQHDVTDIIRQQLALGATSVTFAVWCGTVSRSSFVFNSDEAGANGPVLRLEEAGPPPPPHDIVVSTGQITVPEGAVAEVTAMLAARPAADVFVTIAKGPGADPDLNVVGSGVLTFTPDNWDVPQTVAIEAAHDDDAGGEGTAVFTLSADGLRPRTVTALEHDDDSRGPDYMLRPRADAYVRDGTHAGTNYGAATRLEVKRGATGYNRESHLRFELGSALDPASAILRLFGRLDNTQAASAAFAVHSATNTTWSETGITFNAKPVAGAAVHGSGTVAGTAGAWYEVDLSSFIKAQRAAGATAVTLVLKATAASPATIVFDSDESANAPHLLITPEGPPRQGLVVSPRDMGVAEGGSASFTVQLAAPATWDVLVTLARSARGDADLSTGTTSLWFTADNWNVPQTVTIAAAEDDDDVRGTAAFNVSADGLSGTAVNVTEVDNDAPATPTPAVLRAAADAYVRDGSYAAANYGTAADLVVKRSGTAGNSREAYLRFDLSSVATITSAKLRLFGRLSATTNPSLATTVYGAADTTWGETGVTWNTKPAAGTTSRGSVIVSGTTGKWNELDLTTFLKAEKAAGRNLVTLVLKNSATSDAQTLFASDEASTNRPELVIG